MIVTLRGSIDDVMVDKLQESYNLLRDDDIMTLYLRSNGGGLQDTAQMKDMIESCGNRTRLIASGYVMSAAINLMLFTDCLYKDVLKGTYGMLHHAIWQLDIKEDGTPRGHYERFAIESMSKGLIWSMDEILKYIPVTRKERKHIDDGQDLYISYERLQKAIQKTQ